MKALVPRMVATMMAWASFTKHALAQDFGGSMLEGVGKEVFGTTPSAAAESLPATIGRYIQIFISVLGIIFLILIVYAGWLWLTARGDEKRVQSAKDTIQRAVIGLIIVIAAYAITSFVISRLVTGSAGA